MKKMVFNLIAGLMLVGTYTFAQDDVSIDNSGNIILGTSASANLEVTGASAERAVAGLASGTGGTGVEGKNVTYGNFGILGGFYGPTEVGVYGFSTSGYAGYFEGDARVTGDFIVDGTVTGYTEIDPIFSESAASLITLGQITNWDMAYGWGDHSTAGYDLTNDAWIGTGDIYVTTGNVGIGTTSPGAKLDVEGSGIIGSSNSIATGTWAVALGANADAINNYALATGTGTTASGSYSTAMGVDITVSGNRSFGIGLGGPATAVTANNVMSIMGGNVGIGETNPAERLTVAGTIESTSGGIKFPDGTIQTTASAPTWHQILPASERFVLVMNNEAVLDRETGLVWEQSPSTTPVFEWKSAPARCYGLEKGGRKGWHLPTVEQLTSLVDSTNTDPALPTGHPFADVQSDGYWSATTDTFYSNLAWAVNFGDGNTGTFLKPNEGLTWCVRGGQSYDGADYL